MVSRPPHSPSIAFPSSEAGGVGLGVAADLHDLKPHLRHRRGDVGGSGGFSDATLPVDGYSSHGSGMQLTDITYFLFSNTVCYGNGKTYGLSP